MLSALLAEGGLMRLGLYSSLGLRAVSAGRKFVADHGFEATAEGIRAARGALLRLDPGPPAFPVTQFRDFYTLSECRDLVFHVQEHCLSLTKISELLNKCGLKLLGFSFSSPEVVERYKARYPDDVATTDLSNWNAFEQMFPDTFEEMYQFWCQKT